MDAVNIYTSQVLYFNMYGTDDYYICMCINITYVLYVYMETIWVSFMWNCHICSISGFYFLFFIISI